jgi:electron transfer flavoprotein beta subunit
LNILVCVKQVPDTAQVNINPKTNTLDRSRAPTIINPYDEHAVEEAVQIKKRYGGSVFIVSMGPPQADKVIKKCIEMGADKGYLLTDRAFAGSDTLATSHILAMSIKKIMEDFPIDIIFCGKQAIDGDTAQVGPGIACWLKIPQLTYVEKIESVNPDKKFITVRRKVIEDGCEIIRCKLPCLLTVEKNINTLSVSDMKNMIKATSYKPVVWNVNDFQTDLNCIGLKGSPTSVRKIFPPPQRTSGEILKGSNDEIVSQLIEKLRDEVKIDEA